jgi:hypothetical protein
MRSTSRVNGTIRLTGPTRKTSGSVAGNVYSAFSSALRSLYARTC